MKNLTLFFQKQLYFKSLFDSFQMTMQFFHTFVKSELFITWQKNQFEIIINRSVYIQILHKL